MSDSLIDSACAARDRALAPFSHFKVGAAIEDDQGRIFTGCNIENASYGLTMCAERVAIFKALSEGSRKFTRIVVAADTNNLTPPCGACRQILWEFCGDARLTLVNLEGQRDDMQLSDIFPRPFDANHL
jgi:cytidine deaminase